MDKLFLKFFWKNNGIDSLEKLATYSEKELLKLHGIGKSAIPVLREIIDFYSS